MEILIVGVIVVALMVYVSTKIKRNAAEAFEEETIEAEDFVLVKPEGFLNPVVNESGSTFYAYSKEYGEEGKAEKSRQGLIKVKVSVGRTLKAVCDDVKKTLDTISAEEKIGENTVLLNGERSEKEVETVLYHKIVAAGEKVFDLEMTILTEVRENFEERAEKLLASFRVK